MARARRRPGQTGKPHSGSKLPDFTLSIHHLGDEEYGINLLVDGRFAGAADIGSDEELLDKIGGIIESWMRDELKSKERDQYERSRRRR
jgi:hypothetical protein